VIAPERDDFEDNEEPTRSAGSSRIVLWLILLGLGILFVPVYLVGITIKESRGPLETELTQIQATLTITPQPNPTEQALTDNLIQVRSQIANLATVQSDLTAAHIDWPSVMAIISSYDPSRMAITGLAQVERAITVEGQANDQQAVMDYAELLRQSNQFQDVTIRSIALQPIPTATPERGATPVPATPGTTAAFVLMLQLKSEASS